MKANLFFLPGCASRTLAWELEDRAKQPSFNPPQEDITAYGSRSQYPSEPRWPFQETDQDKQPHFSPPAPPPPPPPINPPIHHQPAPSPRRSGHTRHVLRYWGLEIFTLFVAISLLTAIIWLLTHYDGHYMPKWPFEINLNSAIALLSTFLRAAIVAAVAEIIGQIKWTWFAEQTRPLQHLQDFDAASRSILGSTKLLAMLVWNLGFSSTGFLAIGAAIVTIASLAVGPVTQQAVRTMTCPMLEDNIRARIPAANYVPGSSAYYRVGAGSYEIEVDMKSAMIQGITDPGSQDSDVQVLCPSGNCTWPDYGTGVTHASIGVCSKCIDTTSFVSEPDTVGNLSLPDDGAVINILAGKYMWMGYSNLTAYTKLFSDDFAAAAPVSMANFSMLMISTSPCTSDNSTGTSKLTCPHRLSQSDNSYFSNLGDYVAASCILYPCLKEYHARYVNNTLTETVVRTTTAASNPAENAASRYSLYGNYTARQSPCVIDNGTWYDTTNQSQALDVPGRIWTNFSVSGSDEVTRVPNECLYKMDGTFFSALSTFLKASLLSASCRQYIALPIILVGLCGILLGWIILKNYNDPEQPVWKGSVLPLLFFGLHDTMGPKGTAGGASNGGDGPRDGVRMARNMTFFKENGRSAPELHRIQQESGRMRVRFHGGMDPGFLDLGTGRSDPEAANASFVSVVIK
ncbi:uncharacterized protein CLUP02_02035 [Colletotrichum lupini]|uniref:Uncharacterized protein n=1 Tax=Colletotrichum lupini TaxID=145971 RepID=A0A9Q8W9U9_9PEZI|nr:uncharacterized protein CLUP02_02035 [Colletotrichum lupini]UQC75381.1 hypothetical protein CLUP02_02035 [Colletotrichum lupini]